MRGAFQILFMLAAGLAHAESGENRLIEAKFEAIQKAIEEYESAHPGRTLSIPQVLARLPQKFRSGFALMHTSRSAQEASAQAPRVLMFGDDARTILTFNGDRAQAGHNKLEFASVNDENGKLEFRFMEFPENDTTDGKVRFSQVNPARCLACHGEAPHYIWGGYARWPGAYGSLDDVLELSDGELANFKKFAAGASERPRYRSLNFEFHALSANAPFREFVKGGSDERGSYQQALEVRPNARLSMLILRHQARARIADMADSPEFEKYKFGLAFHLAGCDESVSASPMTKATGLKDFRDFAAKLGSPPETGWHFRLRTAGESDYFFYYSGLWTFDTLLSYFLWDKSFIQNVKWRVYFTPFGIADELDGLSYKIFAGDRGREMFRVLDREGRVPKAFKGSDEFKGYVKKADRDDQTAPIMKRMCEELVDAQLGALGARL